jgi:Ca-activated chloride channel family protein
MTFLHPEFLYYMLPLILILFGFLLTQKEAQAHYFSDEVISRLRVSANTLTLRARNALFMLIAILMTIALADPVIKNGKIEVKAKSADIMLALDISDSMLAEDVYPNRLKLAKQKALQLLSYAPNERIGVIAFAKNSYLVSPLSFDHDAVKFLLSKLDTSSITEQGTNFMAMLEVVDRSIKKDSKKYLLLLTDGGDKKDFSKEIAFAKEKGIAIFVLGVGTKQGAPIKQKNGEFIKQNGKIIVSKLNENIADLATKTGGVYIQSVNSDEDVKTMLQEIERHSKKKELKSQEIEKFIPLFYYPLGLALLLLLIATSSMSKRVKVNVPGAFILGLMFLHSTDSNAALLDFMDIKEAKQAYEKKEYEKSAQLYDNYAKSSNHGESYYNAGNAFYKAGKYKEAIKNYEEAKFDDKISRAKNLSNMGNAYVKMGGEENLKKAVEAYEASLKMYEDKDTRENLEAVKKALQKKKQQQQNQDQKDQNKKDDKNKKNKDQKNKDQNKKDQKDQNKKNDENKKDSQGSKNDQNKDPKDNKSSKEDKKGQEKEDKNKDMKSKKQSDEEKKRQEENAKNQKEQKEKENKNAHDSKKEQQMRKQEEKAKEQDKKMKQEKAAQEKKKEEEKNKEKGSQGEMIQGKPMKNVMSDAEEKKWLKALNQDQNSYLYMLSPNNTKKDNSNEKPW